MQPKYPEITVGELIINKLKDHFFKGDPWTPKLGAELSKRMTFFKHKTRIFYPELDEIGFLHKIAGYSQKDIADIFENYSAKEGGSCTESQARNGGELIEGFMANKSI